MAIFNKKEQMFLKEIHKFKLEMNKIDKMSAESEFWCQNKAACVIRGTESGVPAAVQGKMFY